MTTIHHLNCGTFRLPSGFTSTCHCLLLADPAGLALIDTGLGLEDVARPLERL